MRPRQYGEYKRPLKWDWGQFFVSAVAYACYFLIGVGIYLMVSP